jgi:Transposase
MNRSGVACSWRYSVFRFSQASSTSHRSLPDLPARTLATRVSKGEHNWKENGDAKGYKGSPQAIYRYLETLEALSFSARKSGSPSATKPLNPLVTLSAQQATWLFFRRPEELKQEERETLRQLRQASPHLEAAYRLVETFLQMVRERTGEYLDAWLGAVEASHLEAFESFVTGVQQDKDAVLAGLTLEWSNGPLEGHVNRLKLIKRSVYSRAEIDLLKLRVLHHSTKSQSRKNKKNKEQGQQVVLLKKPKSMKNNTNSQHTISGISKVALRTRLLGKVQNMQVTSLTHRLRCHRCSPFRLVVLYRVGQ